MGIAWKCRNENRFYPKKKLYIIINFFYLFTLKKKLRTPSIKFRITLKLKKKKEILFVLLLSKKKKKKKILTKQAASPPILKKKQRTASPTSDDDAIFLQDFYDKKLKKSCIFVVCNWGWEGGRGRDLLGREWRDWEGWRGRDLWEKKKDRKKREPLNV